MSIQIPEGFEKLKWSIKTVSAPSCYYYNVIDESGTPLITGLRDKNRASFIASFPALAAEIKRLEAENAELKSIALSRGMELNDAAYDEELNREEFARLRARIALLESALGLPEGCDVFDMERIQRGEFAVNKYGQQWQYVTRVGDTFVFELQGTQRIHTKTGLILGSEQVTDLRLYCRKEANK